MAYELVSTFTVPSTGQTDTITFSNIPQTGKQLLLLVSSRDNNARFFMRVNGGASNAFDFRRVLGGSTSVSTSAGTTVIVSSNSTGSTSNTFGNASIMIGDYTNSSRRKPIGIDAITNNNNTGDRVQMFGSASATTTSAITSVSISDTVFSPNTVVSLYIIS